MTRLGPPDPEIVRRARELEERRLSPEEFEAALAAATTEEALAEKRALIEWFTRRYPTPAERLAYARRYRQAVLRRAQPR